ncbi:tubulin-specific chaperone A [Elsinoe australis]|uniref:Tubulin-specific chaperone A n=1 Tax=Elsinoe australis TaxID=40998 RepID=A0A4U7ATH1_9PEZI|nr:tubulin-specific chaperone A [Elsinoe australis]
MPPPSQLAIATSAVNRLIKEESSYHKELEQQKARIAKLEANNGDEYEIKQEKQALDETHKVFPALHVKIKDAVAKLEAQVEQEKGGETATEEITKAKDAVTAGKIAVRETA